MVNRTCVRPFNSAQLRELAAAFNYQKSDPIVTKGDFLTKETFLRIARWKTERPGKHYLLNAPCFVEDVTRASFSANTERLRIEALRLLHGVDYPVASALLHFGFAPERYPIIDFRTLWSLYDIEDRTIAYDFSFWDSYQNDCLALSSRHGMTIRELDKALWQYSRIHQNKRQG